MKRYILLFLLMAITVFGHAQSIRTPSEVIKGKVIDSASGKPVAGASVYLNGTYQGVTSKEDGSFTLKSSEVNIPLIVSHIGYQTQNLANYAGKNLVLKLKPKPTELREVTIGDNTMSREEEMRIFLTEFIGSRGKDCVISNPDDIYFSFHKNTQLLTAGADKPLVIYNKKLGYKITYFLSGFRHLLTSRFTFYQGNYFFAEDTAGTQPKVLKKIIKERDSAYFGSRMHFIRSLWANKLAQNHFRLYKTSLYKTSGTEPFLLDEYLFMLDTLKARILNNARSYRDIIVIHDQKKFLSVKDTILIVDLNHKRHDLKASFLLPVAGNKQALINENGYYGVDILWSGEMALQRVNKLLPFEFEPSNYVAPKKSTGILHRLF